MMNARKNLSVVWDTRNVLGYIKPYQGLPSYLQAISAQRLVSVRKEADLTAAEAQLQKYEQMLW